MGIYFRPYAFDAEKFTAGVARCSGPGQIARLLLDCGVDEPSFDWSLDGTIRGDLVGARLDPAVGGKVSLVQHLRLGLRRVEGDHSEACTLLGHLSESDGRLAENDDYGIMGYLSLDEIRRLSTLLDE